MRSPNYHRNGVNTPSSWIPSPHCHSTVSLQKLKRFNYLILLFRLASFCFSLSSAVFMATNTSKTSSPVLRWFDFDSFRYVVAANGIVAVYSLFETAASVWEISTKDTLLPELVQVWFDFGHDQVFAYLLLSANSAGTTLALTMRVEDTCTTNKAFCVQASVSIGLGFAGFLFLSLSTLLSGYRVVCFLINGSRFHL